ncbi:hypothetical protein DYY88_18035 [Leptolyngbya iicbica LK]|uniref:Uncharacterized protein n=2 Tax=Cyanophyceae TaxID=3028117 RepID=A0A4Q7E4D1_9CYAN|nr:hypothetical protein [Leptolyngbya sp. LK]RZM76564.1 hypothetical protein DYY88_18035 [Leptolyngbya sp. LK]
MVLNTALDAYQAFAQIEPSDRHHRLLGNLRTVLRRYVLPYYGIHAKGRSGQLEAALAQLPIPLLVNDANWFLQQLENPTSPDEQAAKLSQGAIATYRATLLQFLEWLYRQQPQPDSFQESSPESSAPTICSLNSRTCEDRSLRKGRDRGTKTHGLISSSQLWMALRRSVESGWKVRIVLQAIG